MLDEKRIKEAENNVRQYLQEDLLKKEEFNQIIFDVLEKNSDESLEVANMLFENDSSYLWVIVTSYYSMFYIANAVLYKFGYKVGEKISHKVTSDALIVYIRKKLGKSMLEEYDEAKNEVLNDIRADTLIESFDYERRKRSTIQYKTTEEAKKSKAKTSLERAKKFKFEIEKLIDEI